MGNSQCRKIAYLVGEQNSEQASALCSELGFETVEKILKCEEIQIGKFDQILVVGKFTNLTERLKNLPPCFLLVIDVEAEKDLEAFPYSLSDISEGEGSEFDFELEDDLSYSSLCLRFRSPHKNFVDLLLSFCQEYQIHGSSFENLAQLIDFSIESRTFNQKKGFSPSFYLEANHLKAFRMRVE